MDYTECPFIEIIETSYDVLSGHSDYLYNCHRTDSKNISPYYCSKYCNYLKNQSERTPESCTFGELYNKKCKHKEESNHIIICAKDTTLACTQKHCDKCGSYFNSKNLQYHFGDKI